MEQFRYSIKDKLGIHARPAGLLVKEATAFTSSITISVNDKQASANKLFAIMGLNAKYGDELTVTVEGKDEKVAVKAMRKFFEQNL